MIDTQKKNFQRRLREWYAAHKRDLPWRGPDVSAWGILMSEIMLQQTTVAAVVSYWHKFMKLFPSPQHLADASEDEVLSLWSGLGYYRRARNLQATARILATQHHNTVPPDFAIIRSLPGVGRYTAGAVASFAFNIPAPIVEANTVRVLARLGAIGGTSHEPLWQLAEKLLPQTNIATHNYALMELGSLVCKPADPLCGQCPVCEFCEAHKRGEVALYPTAKVKPQKVALRFAALVLQWADWFLMRRIPLEEWHGGMMEFPKIERFPKQLVPNFSEIIGQYPKLNSELFYWKTVKYTITHHSITLDVWRMRQIANSKRKPAAPHSAQLEWVHRNKLDALPCASATRKLVHEILAQLRDETTL